MYSIHVHVPCLSVLCTVCLPLVVAKWLLPFSHHPLDLWDHWEYCQLPQGRREWERSWGEGREGKMKNSNDLLQSHYTTVYMYKSQCFISCTCIWIHSYYTCTVIRKNVKAKIIHVSYCSIMFMYSKWTGWENGNKNEYTVYSMLQCTYTIHYTYTL